MSFPAFVFKELAKEEWEESTLRDMFESTKFFFIVFKGTSNSSVFLGAKFWAMPVSDFDNTVKLAWKEVQETINGGVSLVYKGERVKNNLLKASAKRIIHVRPHSSKSSYIEGNSNADELPVPAKWTDKPEEYSDRWMTKQCFWLYNDYVIEQIKDLL